MRTVATAVIAIGLLGPVSAVRGADDYKDTIVGTWEIVYSDAKVIPVGTKLEFTRDGKVIATVKIEGKDVLREDAYKIEKDVLILTGEDGKKNDKGRICLLNKSSFVINDEVEDKVMVLKKVKAK